MDTTEMINKIFDYLTRTSELLATEGYRLAYRQAIISGWINIVGGILLVILAIIGFRMMTVYAQKRDPDDRFEFQLVGTLLLLVGGICSPITLSIGIVEVLNPGWKAIQFLMQMVSFK